MEKLNLCIKNVSGVYLITNLENGHRYIGSSNDLYERIYKHIYELSNNKHINTHLQNAYNKYGNDKFVVGILEICQEEERFNREKFFIDTLHPEYNIAGISGEEILVMSEETKSKISSSVTESWKNGKLSEFRNTTKAWSIPCFVYDVETWTLVKECSNFKEATNFMQLNDDLSQKAIGFRLFKDRYVVLLNKIENQLDIKNKICEDIFYYNAKNLKEKKYLIAENDGKLFYFRSLAALVRKFGSSKSTLDRNLKTASKENPYIIKNTKIKVWFSYDFIKHTAV